jgi:hypothetical protein
MIIKSFLFAVAVLSISLNFFAENISQNNDRLIPEIQYLSPLPGAKFVTKETSIIIRFKQETDLNKVTFSDFLIEGSLSGIHSYEIIKTNEKNTLILKPHFNFAENEIVKITVPEKFFNTRERPYEYRFQISDYRLKRNHEPRIPYANYSGLVQNSYSNSLITGSEDIKDNNTPPDFPKITVTRKYETAPGYIFVSNFPFGPLPFTPYLMVLNNLGQPVLYKKMNLPCFDFKLQNSNMFTYFDGSKGKFYSTNTSFDILDSFYCGNGYGTDLHELLLLPNNNAYLMSYDSQYVNMSQIVPGGDSNAVVSGLIIQEIDANKNVIFQWRSWDHFQITDATHEDLTAKSIDYVHGNAIEIDHDGHVLISSRHMDEITKINRQTGNIIWRLGGKNNQFNFKNDPIMFSYQHSIRRLDNGNYLLFDNGNYHNPPFSRAVEYNLNTQEMSATLVWQYRNAPNIYGFAMGSVQRLPNGNTLIGWGSTSPSVSEVRPNGTKVYEMKLPAGQFSYRAFRHTWDGAPPEELPKTFTLQQNYPNPFNPSTTVKYDLTEHNFVTLKIYDMTGREISTIVSENQPAGTYVVDFSLNNIASGVYFYKLVAGGYSEARKMIFIK